MRKFLTALVSGSLLFCTAAILADNHEEDANVATPMEMFACKFNEGKSYADLDAPVKRFNSWADKNDIDGYSAWTLVPYYSSTQQDFDVLWLGGSDDAKTLGRVQDMWLSTGSKEQAAFAEVATCDTHAGYSVLQMKEPPTREDPSNIVVTFTDCKISESSSFDELYMPMMEWGKYMGEHGSTAGMWVFLASYGGGGEEFDIKWVEAFQNLEDLGADWDHVNESGWQKANELFAGKIDCDSARAYMATNRRMAESDED